MKFAKFAFFLVWYTPYAIMGGTILGIGMWWDDLVFEWNKTMHGTE